MSGSAGRAPRFARGVRFRRLEDGSGVLLVPEGVVNLTETAAAIVELVDGVRTPADMAAALGKVFDAPPDRISADVSELLGRLSDKTWILVPDNASS